MSVEYKMERRIGGIKAKYVDSDTGSAGSKNEQLLPAILVISPNHRRIGMILQSILEKQGKHLDLAGVELYRQAISRLQADLSSRVVALVITEIPDDHYASTRESLPMWQSLISVCQQMYQRTHAKEIGDGIYPLNLTVITLFRGRQGKMSDEEIEKIVQEFEAYQNQVGMTHKPCQSEAELQNAVDQDVLGFVIQRHRQTEMIRKYDRNRTQKIAKAKKITKDAHKKLLTGS